MAASPLLLIFVFLGCDWAWAARKSVDLRLYPSRNFAGHQGVRSSGHFSTEEHKNHIQNAVSNSITAIPVVASGSQTVTFSVDHSKTVRTKTWLALLEQSSLVVRAAKSKAFGFNHVCGLSVLIVLLLLCILLRSKNKKHEIETEELVKRLSQCLPMSTLKDSSEFLGSTTVEQRYIAMWWPKDSHAWASTRLGWWESKRHYGKRSRALGCFLLREISEVRQTERAEVCVIHEGRGPGRPDKLLFFFATRKFASQYAEDLKLMVRRVKADAEERAQRPSRQGSEDFERQFTAANSDDIRKPSTTGSTQTSTTSGSTCREYNN